MKIGCITHNYNSGTEKQQLLSSQGGHQTLIKKCHVCPSEPCCTTTPKTASAKLMSRGRNNYGVTEYVTGKPMPYKLHTLNKGDTVCQRVLIAGGIVMKIHHGELWLQLPRQSCSGDKLNCYSWTIWHSVSPRTDNSPSKHFWLLQKDTSAFLQTTQWLIYLQLYLLVCNVYGVSMVRTVVGYNTFILVHILQMYKCVFATGQTKYWFIYSKCISVCL